MSINSKLDALAASVAAIGTGGGTGTPAILTTIAAGVASIANEIGITGSSGTPTPSPTPSPTPAPGTGAFVAAITGINVPSASAVAVGTGLFSPSALTVGGVTYSVTTADSLNSIAANLLALLQPLDPAATAVVGGAPNSASLTVTSKLAQSGFTGAALTGNTPTFVVAPVVSQ